MLLAKPNLLDATRQLAAARIKRPSRGMNRLITDLLEYPRTRLGAGIPIDRSARDLGPVCEALLRPRGKNASCCAAVADAGQSLKRPGARVDRERRPHR